MVRTDGKLVPFFRVTVYTQISKQLARNEHLSAQLTTLVRFQLFLALVTLLCIATIICIYYLGDKLVIRRKVHHHHRRR